MINPDLMLTLLILYTIAYVLIVGDGFNFLRQKVRDALNFMHSEIKELKERLKKLKEKENNDNGD